MPHTRFTNEEIDRRGQELYANRIRAEVENEANIGKIVVIDIETGACEIDAIGFRASERLREKHPDAALLGLRIGYDAVEGFGAGPRRLKQCIHLM